MSLTRKAVPEAKRGGVCHSDLDGRGRPGPSRVPLSSFLS